MYSFCVCVHKHMLFDCDKLLLQKKERLWQKEGDWCND